MKSKVLIIEDQRPILEMVEEFIGLMGYSSLSALDFESARLVTKENSDEIGVVICDVYLKNQNGADLMKELITWIPDAVVVFTSGFSTESMLEKSYGFPSLFLEKPFSFDTLKNILEEAFSHVRRC